MRCVSGSPWNQATTGRYYGRGAPCGYDSSSGSRPCAGRDTMGKTFIPRLLVAFLSATVLLSACQTAPTTSPGAVAPGAAALPALPVPGAAHYAVDTGLS